MLTDNQLATLLVASPFLVLCVVFMLGTAYLELTERH